MGDHYTTNRLVWPWMKNRTYFVKSGYVFCHIPTSRERQLALRTRSVSSILVRYPKSKFSFGGLPQIVFPPCKLSTNKKFDPIPYAFYVIPPPNRPNMFSFYAFGRVVSGSPRVYATGATVNRSLLLTNGSLL